jgi:hypothetical protein
MDYGKPIIAQLTGWWWKKEQQPWGKNCYSGQQCGPGFDILNHKNPTMVKQTNGKKDKTKTSLQPDKKTLHKTDPQENMEGPVSSIMQNIKESSEKDNKESKEAADLKKDKNM